MKDLIIIGAGGQGRETAQLVKDINKFKKTWNLLGYVDDSKELAGKIFNGFPVLGSTNLLTREHNASIICAIGNSRLREKVIKSIEKKCGKQSYATLIHPSAVIGDDTIIHSGTMICANAVITTNVRIGHHVLVNYGTTIGHDVMIEDYVSVLPGVNVSGNVTLQRAVDVGSGASILPGVNIDTNTIIGAGAVVTKDLPSNCTAVGVPAKPIKYHE